MLVLSRKPGERILLRSDDGEEMEICLVRIGPNNARIGIDAPRRWNIVREEIAGRGGSGAETSTGSRRTGGLEDPDDVARRQMALALSDRPVCAEAACDVA
jgi:carbon storage regulator CsrA